MGRGYNQRRGDNRSNKQNDTPLEDRVKNKDIYMRMNFLYQMSVLTATGPSKNSGLSRFYASTMKRVGSRTVVRIDHSIKSTVCKRCHSSILPIVETNQIPEIPTSTSDKPDADSTKDTASKFTPNDVVGGIVELGADPQPKLIRTCRKCGTQRRIGTKQEMRKASEAGED